MAIRMGLFKTGNVFDGQLALSCAGFLAIVSNIAPTSH
jgi:hypothetical protein